MINGTERLFEASHVAGTTAACEEGETPLVIIR
jgi:hypothetical protein